MPNAYPAHGPSRVTLAVTLLLLAGCTGPFAPENDLEGPSLAELHEIETVQLQNESAAEPLTVEEAAEDALEDLFERPEPPAKIDLSLGDVRAAALSNNLDLNVVLMNPAISQTFVDEEEAKFDATFFGSARHSINDEPVEFATQSGQSDITSVNAGVEIPLRTGGTVTVNFPFGRSETNNLFAVLNPAYDANVEMSISHELLRGAGIEANTFSIKVARYNRKISDAQTKLEAIRILANADRAYWLVYAARRQLEVRQQQYELAVEQMESAQRRVEAGDSPEIEVIRAETGVANSLEQIIVSETILKRRQRNLKRILNRPDLPMGYETALITTTEANPVYLELDPIALGEYAVANRMEMLELELQIAIDTATVGFQKNQALPLVTVDYTYRLNGRAASMDEALEQIGRSQFSGWTLGLNARVPITNEAAKARVHGAILTRLQRLATKEQRRLAILQEVYDAVDLLNQEWQRILAARLAAVLAARTWEGERRQFEVGLRTSTDVLIAAANLADAQSAEVQALVDYEIARVDIAFGTGTLLGFDRIRWEPIDDKTKGPAITEGR